MFLCLVFMAEFDLNLSNRPFPAYRLINIALLLILGVLGLPVFLDRVKHRRG